MQAFFWLVVRALMKLGIAMAASRPMMATTIMISTSVNPPLRVFVAFIFPSSFWLEGMIGDRTGRLRIHIVDVIRAARRTSGLVPDVLVRTIEVGGHRSVRADLLLFERPGLLRAVNLLEVRDAGVLLARGPRFDEVRNRDRSQQADDGYHNHDFNQGETSAMVSVSLHSFLPTFFAA